ncbi:uracil-DNA glycosylase [Candidatus Similichlamydia laticola]|uniref:Uracil-DNA glycosylase n=1 Tax=Candidatus Similichlamydia laticola TaxID=2170265 RepID=A0A369KH83_9BACT|nr:uracil-DNA glycosylase [Candidatus Similichlamydia laticola]RDB31153.1 Uracil-DNA glycosylase, family 1 [Candidatus Similichlamydia laticola]
MLRVDRSWSPLFEALKSKAYFRPIFSFLREEQRKGHVIYPHPRNIFRAFQETTLEQVRVVILGQDPYHGPGQADGLCFSVPEGVPLPPSLRNIFKELASDLGCLEPHSGSLELWASQGVLLLNSLLSVRSGQPLSHKGIGWELFLQDVLDFLWNREQPLAFILWGRSAAQLMTRQEQREAPASRLLIKSAHPSPLSAHYGFWGSRPFSQVNRFLLKQGLKPIEWERVSDSHSRRPQEGRLNGV